MILSRLFAEVGWGWTRSERDWVQRYGLLLLLLGAGACGPKKPMIPDTIEAIARRCYATLVTHERTPQLKPSAVMEDGTFLILWSIAEFPDERGSCNVDGNGSVLLLTNNADEQTHIEENSNETPASPESIK